ncbi:MAG: hypothetical protein KHX56_07485 [Clostridiales bacterium]|nr:hypothetical protein [Clostridiales bacterium]
MQTQKSGFYEVYEHRIDLRSILEELSKKELESLCRRHGIRGYSHWNKNDMIGHISEYILSLPVIYNYFICMNDEEIEYLRMAADCGGIIDEAEPEAFSYMMLGGYAGFTKDLEFGVPFEVLERFLSFDDEVFEQKRRRICLIGNYCHVANYLYGVCPPMKVVKMFNQYERKKTDWREVIGVYDTIVKYRCDFVYIDCYFVDTAFQKNYEELLAIQENMPYYMPSREALEEWFQFGFSVDTEYILELYKYMTEQLWMDKDTAADVCFMLENTVHIGCTVSRVLGELQRLGIRCRTRRQDREFKALLGSLINNTRMVIFRGFTPLEVARMKGIT